MKATSLFFGDDDAEQLVLESFWRDHEIQQQNFGSDFRQIVRISQLRCYVESKICIVLDNILAETDHISSTCIQILSQLRTLLKATLNICLEPPIVYGTGNE